MKSYLALLLLTVLTAHLNPAQASRGDQPAREKSLAVQIHNPQPIVQTTDAAADLTQQLNDFDAAMDYLYEGKLQVAQLKTYQQHLQQGQTIFVQLSSQLDADDYDQMRFINHYATLLANYAELLDRQHCDQQALGYWEQSDHVYQVGKIFQKQYPTLAYNRSLNFARQSVFYRKNNDHDQKRLELLNQAESIAAELNKNQPQDKSFYQHYLNVLLDQLDIYQKQANSYPQQKARFDQLTPSYFKVLQQKNAVDDFGNTIIFIQKYYRFLFIQDPTHAEQWLKQQHAFIENYRKHTAQLSQREKEFLAGYYAVNRQFDLAMYYLDQIDPKDDDATAVQDFKVTDPLYANIRFRPEFQTWLNHYENQYVAEQPKQCRIKTL